MFEQRRALFAFLEKNRSRIGTFQGNVLAMIFGDIGHYQLVLTRVLDRYTAVTSRYLGIQKQIERFPSGEGPRDLTPDEIAILRQSNAVASELRQEIETFYLFARILLDRVTQATHTVFGRGTGQQDSHRKFIASFSDYASAKNLDPPSDELLRLMRDFESAIIDFRDDAIVHASSPRGLRHFVFQSLNENEVYLSYNRLYPEKGDQQVDGMPLTRLMHRLTRYVDLWLEYLEVNADKMFVAEKRRERVIARSRRPTGT